VRRLVFTPAARSDLRGIWLYSFERWGPDQADEYTDAIEAACHLVAGSVSIGKPLTARRGYRKWVVRSHVLYLREFPDRIEVIRILHMRQDPDIHLSE
jgi:toxin ParE1/3/4